MQHSSAAASVPPLGVSHSDCPAACLQPVCPCVPPKHSHIAQVIFYPNVPVSPVASPACSTPCVNTHTHAHPGFQAVVDFSFKGGNTGFPVRAPPILQRGDFSLCTTNVRGALRRQAHRPACAPLSPPPRPAPPRCLQHTSHISQHLSGMGQAGSWLAHHTSTSCCCCCCPPVRIVASALRLSAHGITPPPLTPWPRVTPLLSAGHHELPQRPLQLGP